jgi:hypothetical protein
LNGDLRMKAFEFKIQKPSSFKTYSIGFPNVLVHPSNFKVKKSSWYVHRTNKKAGMNEF